MLGSAGPPPQDVEGVQPLQVEQFQGLQDLQEGLPELWVPGDGLPPVELRQPALVAVLLPELMGQVLKRGAASLFMVEMENSQIERKRAREDPPVYHLVGEVQLQPGPDVGAAEEVVGGGVLGRDAEDEGAALRAPEEVRAQAPVRQRRLRQLQHPPEVLCSGNSSIHFLLCPFFTTSITTILMDF